MKKEAWRRAKGIEEEFLGSMRFLLKTFTKIARSSGAKQEEYTESMRNFQNSFQYEKFIYSAVRRMVTPIGKANMATWRKAAKKSTKSTLIHKSLLRELNEGLAEDMKSQIEENVSLIRTLPTDVAEKVVKEVNEKTVQGMRASEIAKLIQSKTNQHAGASARLIARTEVSKTTTALTRARSENLGLKWYIWRTAEDGDRVRKSHRNMEGVLVRWDTPPSPESLVNEKSEGNYHAGNIWNCRCYPEPLIDFDDIKWPARVYHNGKIQKMSKKEFENL